MGECAKLPQKHACEKHTNDCVIVIIDCAVKHDVNPASHRMQRIALQQALLSDVPQISTTPSSSQAGLDPPTQLLFFGGGGGGGNQGACTKLTSSAGR